jgi:hypothetical protein
MSVSHISDFNPDYTVSKPSVNFYTNNIVRIIIYHQYFTTISERIAIGLLPSRSYVLPVNSRTYD